MNALSLLTKKGFLASKEAHAEVERAMASGELRATGSVITRPGAHLYVGDSYVTKTYAQPVTVRDESDALALIRSEELTSQNTTVTLAIEILGGCSTQQLYLGHYSADADTYWLSFMRDDFSYLDVEGRRRVMRRIHEGHGTVLGHLILTLPDLSADALSILSVSYHRPVPVSDGPQMTELIDRICLEWNCQI